MMVVAAAACGAAMMERGEGGCSRCTAPAAASAASCGSRFTDSAATGGEGLLAAWMALPWSWACVLELLGEGSWIITSTT